ncbi:MAG: hypothetical protein HDQ97_17255 [Lachnospiraceae bacterium]|nr:hypothetical protein [Lachnospiraceae bacterium]
MDRAEIEKKIINCIYKIMNEEGREGELGDVPKNTNLTSDLHFSSLEYVKLIVYLEMEFETEFEDSILDFGAFEEFKTLVDYVVAEVERNAQ